MPGFFCLYIEQFPAWVWEQSTAKLRNKPFVVLERDSVVAVSPAALQAGVTVGMTSARAEAHFRSTQVATEPLIQVERDSRREELAWLEVQRTVYSFTRRVEPIRPGLLFAEVESAKRMTLTRGLELRGGYALDRATAHLAAVSAPPSTTRTIQTGRERVFADALTLEELCGVGLSASTIAGLAWFGWTRLGQLRSLSLHQLEEQFGSEGTLLFLLAQGSLAPANLRPVATWKPPSQIVARIEFEIPAREAADWDGALDELLACACEGLEGQQAQTLEIEAQTPINSVIARRVLKKPVASPHSLRRPAEAALKQALESQVPLDPIIQVLIVRLGGLMTTQTTSSETPERLQTLESTPVQVEGRFPSRREKYALLEPHAPFSDSFYGWLPSLNRFPRNRTSNKVSNTLTDRSVRRAGKSL